MLGLLQHGGVAAECRLGVDEVGGVQGGAAHLALVTVGVLVLAVRARAGDVTVGEELLGLLIVVLHRGLLDELALVVQLLEVGGGRFVMRGVRGSGVDVEGDAEVLERLLDDVMVAVHDVLRGHALLAGLDGDGHAVLVGAADEEHLLAVVAQIARVDVGRDIDAGEVADVDGTVGVR